MTMKKNISGVEITRPDQVLVIMRGIPGAGKSTMAKSLVGDGVIHSTDAVIESMGDYREFFAKMMVVQAAEEAKKKAAKEAGEVYESKVNAFAPLGKAHDTNYKNAVKSITTGISPVIMDNTHIKANEAKKIVVKALELGLDENNIKIVDVGTGGLDAKALFERGTHGVPLEKLESMIKAHKSVGELTVQKILESKDMYPTSPILYSAVVLDNASRTKLLDMIAGFIPADWTVVAHHMTICLGQLKDKTDVGKEVSLVVTNIGKTDKAMAVRVSGYESKNDNPHITIALNPDGGTAKMSNEITKWQDVKHFVVKGIVTEISRYTKKDDKA
jgi:hypothetical protein